MKIYKCVTRWEVVAQIILTKSQKVDKDLLLRAAGIMADESYGNATFHISECGEITRIQKNGYRLRLRDDEDDNGIIELLHREHDFVVQ